MLPAAGRSSAGRPDLLAGQSRSARVAAQRRDRPRRGRFRRPGAYSSGYRVAPPARSRVGAARGAVVTVSEFSKLELVELVGLDPAAVQRDRRRRRRALHARRPTARALRAKLGLRRRYVLTVGDRRRAQEPGRAERRRPPTASSIGVELVRAGDARPHFSAAGERSMGCARSATSTTTISRACTAARARSCSSSLYEGLGLPVPRGDGVGRAGRRRRPGGAAGDVRRRRDPRRTRGPRGDRAGARARARRRADARAAARGRPTARRELQLGRGARASWMSLLAGRRRPAPAASSAPSGPGAGSSGSGRRPGTSAWPLRATRRPAGG